VSDTLEVGTPRKVLVDGRQPFTDETITSSDESIVTIAAADGNGDVFATAVSDGTATITATPGAEDVNRTAGTDDVTVSTPVAPTPLAVTLE
jgi:uncharacterized protein YjdB